MKIQMSGKNQFNGFSLMFKTNSDSGLMLYGETATEYINLELVKSECGF